MVLCKRGITKALTRLRGCAGWSAPVMFATPEDRFSFDEAHMQGTIKTAEQNKNMCAKLELAVKTTCIKQSSALRGQNIILSK